MECLICLAFIDQDDEAYLDRCYHRFHLKCIQAWTEHQRAHPIEGAGAPIFTCPGCRTPYTGIIHDCDGISFSMLPVQAVDGMHSRQPEHVLLTASQRRRRALYMGCVPENESGRVPPMAPHGRVHRPNAAHARSWVRRELQALLLEPDVDLIVQHILGTLGSLAGDRLGADAMSRMYGDSQAFKQAVAAACAGFLPDSYTSKFATKLWGFLRSGLTVEAYDRALFQEAEPGSRV